MNLAKKAVEYMQEWGRNCQTLWMAQEEMPPGAENIVNWLLDEMEKRLLAKRVPLYEQDIKDAFKEMRREE